MFPGAEPKYEGVESTSSQAPSAHSLLRPGKYLRPGLCSLMAIHLLKPEGSFTNVTQPHHFPNSLTPVAAGCKEQILEPLMWTERKWPLASILTQASPLSSCTPLPFRPSSNPPLGFQAPFHHLLFYLTGHRAPPLLWGEGLQNILHMASTP